MSAPVRIWSVAPWGWGAGMRQGGYSATESIIVGGSLTTYLVNGATTRLSCILSTFKINRRWGHGQDKSSTSLVESEFSSFSQLRHLFPSSRRYATKKSGLPPHCAFAPVRSLGRRLRASEAEAEPMVISDF